MKWHFALLIICAPFIFEAQGGVIKDDFVVNDSIPPNQSESSIAMNNSGNFVIVWRDFRAGPTYGETFAQRYNASGDALGLAGEHHQTVYSGPGKGTSTGQRNGR